MKQKNDDDWLWWKHGVIYQIYPRSFLDTDGDGIGDLPGIIEKLDYLSDLGIDGIWLSPINLSPMFDFSYDISDYRKIDPVFGTDRDMKTLIKEAHRRGIRILMDLVFNHSSSLHPWFIESRSSRTNPKRDWYIWHPGKNGKRPNNWLAAFGGNAWEWDEETSEFYLHSFLPEQPDLNWRNEELRKAVYNELKYWLDRGIDGFRLDVVNYYIKDDQFRNNPWFVGPQPRPYDWQRHIYDRDRPEMHPLLREMRRFVDQWDERMLVGEIYTQIGEPDLAASYLGNGTDELHTAFDFTVIYKKWNAATFNRCVENWINQMPPAGWPTNVLSNHDQSRTVSRIKSDSDTFKRARVAAALLLTLKGTPFVYYGEEIGMKDGRIKKSELMDPVGKRYWPFHPGRDRARTPMQWSDHLNAGFTLGKPWLPVNDDYLQVNVSRQLRDSDSLLNFYRKLISLRKKKRSLQMGEWIPVMRGERDILAYYRIVSGEKTLIFLNFNGKTRKIQFDGSESWKVIFSSHKKEDSVLTDLNLNLSPYEVTILEKIPASTN